MVSKKVSPHQYGKAAKRQSNFRHLSTPYRRDKRDSHYAAKDRSFSDQRDKEFRAPSTATRPPHFKFNTARVNKFAKN